MEKCLVPIKVPNFEEQQGRNILISKSKYLSTTMLPLTTPSHLKKKLFTLYGPMISLKFQFRRHDNILGRSSWNGVNLDILIMYKIHCHTSTFGSFHSLSITSSPFWSAVLIIYTAALIYLFSKSRWFGQGQQFYAPRRSAFSKCLWLLGEGDK